MPRFDSPSKTRGCPARLMIAGCLDAAGVRLFSDLDIEFLRLALSDIDRGYRLTKKQRTRVINLFERARQWGAAA